MGTSNYYELRDQKGAHVHDSTSVTVLRMFAVSQHQRARVRPEDLLIKRRLPVVLIHVIRDPNGRVIREEIVETKEKWQK